MKNIYVNPVRAVLVERWKQELSAYFQDSGVISAKYTGKILLEMSDGKVLNMERTERIK